MMRVLRGDCLSCQRLGVCSETNEEKVRLSYTCDLFTGAPEPVYLARLEMMRKFGESMAIKGMLNRPVEVEEEP
jgi:hypothetical protein